MIIHKALHWFECKLPELEKKEKEIFYRHPKWPLKVNQIGIIYFDNDEDILDGTHGQVYRIKWISGKGQRCYPGLGTRARLCYEAYNNELFEGKHFLHIDGNPLNCTQENLLLTLRPKNPDKETLDKYKKAEKTKLLFVKKSIRWMEDKEQWCSSHGIDPEYYWELFGGIPNWLLTARNKQRYKK
jgi:hypothetical protein